jgi:hypothetical protein
MEWRNGSNIWNYSYTDLKPDTSVDQRGTVVFFPSCTLLSTKEEWRNSADLLTTVGFRCILFDWPGWHNRNSPLNWSIEDEVQARRLVSTMTHFAYSALDHIHSLEEGRSNTHIVAAGGHAGVHVRRALSELGSEGKNGFKSLTCFSPSWRYYLTRFVPEGYPRKLARRRAIADWLLDNCFVRSRLMFRIYRSKFGLAKLTRRLYETKLQHDQELLAQKRDIIVRDRPLCIDAAMMSGYFDPVTSTQEFIGELLGVDTSRDEADASNDDSDDDDSLLNIKVPNWVKTENRTDSASETDYAVNGVRIQLVFPQDVQGLDKKELGTVRDWARDVANVTCNEIPGKLFCHEENPALAATIIQDFVS